MGRDTFDQIQGKPIVKIPHGVFVCLVGAAAGIPTGLLYLERKVRSRPLVLKQSQGTAEGYFVGRVRVCLSIAACSGKGDAVALRLAGESTPGKQTGRGLKRVFCKLLTYIWGWEAGESAADIQRGVALRIETETP